MDELTAGTPGGGTLLLKLRLQGLDLLSKLNDRLDPGQVHAFFLGEVLHALQQGDVAR